MTELFDRDRPIGVFKGFTPVPGEMEADVVVPHAEHALPDFGEFVLIGSGSDHAAVARVIHYHAAGPMTSSSGDEYLAELGRTGEELSERVRGLTLRYSMRLQMLGYLSTAGGGFRFSVGARTMAVVGGSVFRPSPQALQYLCNVGLASDDPAVVPFGQLVHGERVRSDVKVHFSVDRLKQKRTFVFARAGYGKSNLVKYLISRLYAAPPDVGLLIFDPEGEYALPQTVGDRRVPGLASLPVLRDRLSLYTSRQVDPEFASMVKGEPYVSFSDFSSAAILNAFVPPEKHDQIWSNWVKGMSDKKQWAALVELLSSSRYGAQDPELEKVLRVKAAKGKDGGQNVSLSAIRNNIVPCLDRLHRPDASLGRNIISELRQGRIVVVDISLLSGQDGLGIAGLLMEKIFFHNLAQFTRDQGQNVVNTLVVMEEAQQILGGSQLSDTSIFVRWVKEGRKYSLGAILITQQPGAISPLILSQGDNFFVMHLLGQEDLRNLNYVNSYYSRDILNYIRTEPIKGNCYFWSAPDQPYVISARVENFDTVIEGYAQAARHPDGSLASRIRTIVEQDDQVWLFTVGDSDQICFSRTFLERKLGASDAQALDRTLLDLGWNPNGGTATLQEKWGPERVVTVPAGRIVTKKRAKREVRIVET